MEICGFKYNEVTATKSRTVNISKTTMHFLKHLTNLFCKVLKVSVTGFEMINLIRNYFKGVGGKQEFRLLVAIKSNLEVLQR